MSSDNEEIQALIEERIKRLRILEKQQAIYGVDCPPHIILEIEDLKQEISELQTQGYSSQRSDDLIDIKSRRLKLLEERAALLGTDTPPVVSFEIEDLRREIEQLKEQIPLENIPTRYSTRKLENDPAERHQVFISYSHNDARWLKRLQVHLKPLVRLGTIALWDDTMIGPGKKWRNEIKKAIDTTKVAVLLVSADFLASDFITENELPPLLAAAETEGAAILSVIVSGCRFQQTKTLSQFQSVNSPERPLNILTRGRQEIYLYKVSEAVERALNP